MKVFITKNSPDMFCSRGASTFTVWFEKPYFKQGVYFDEAFQCALKRHEYKLPQWTSRHHNCVTGHIIKNFSPEIIKYINEAVSKTYKINIYEAPDQFQAYLDIEKQFSNEKINIIKERQPTKSMPENASTEELALMAQNLDKAFLDAAGAVEKQLWHEWILEVELDISLAQ